MTIFDPVLKPKHYNTHPSGIEAIELTRLCPFSLGNAIKYCFRAGLKGPAVEDLRKAIFYLNDYLKHFPLLGTDSLLLPGGLAPAQLVAASRMAMRISDGRAGLLEGFLRSLYGGRVPTMIRESQHLDEWEATHRFVGRAQILVAKVYLEHAIAELDTVKDSP